MVNNSYITQEVFENILTSMLAERGYETEIIESPGLNGTERRLVKKGYKKKPSAVAAIKLNDMYEDYMSSGHQKMFEDVVKEVETLLKKAADITDDDINDMMSSWESAKSRLYLTVYNKDLHADYLKNSVFEVVEDLALAVRVYGTHTEDGVYSCLVTEKMLHCWGVSKEEVMRAAKENGPKLFPVRFINESQFASMIAFSIFGKWSSEMFSEHVEPAVTGEPHICVVTTKDAVTGAALFYDGVLEEIAEYFGNRFYIIPSSMNEFIILPENVGSAEDMTKMIHSVNGSEAVSPDVILSDHPYMYRDGSIVSV